MHFLKNLKNLSKGRLDLGATLPRGRLFIQFRNFPVRYVSLSLSLFSFLVLQVDFGEGGSGSGSPARKIDQQKKKSKETKTEPKNKLPESPKYNFAGGKLKNKKPPIAQSRRIDISVNLYWFK